MEQALDGLKIFELYQDTNSNREQNFKNNLNSNLQVETTYDRVDVNYEWLDLMEGTIRYLDNILRNPNRFIVNEEEIVKVELARRITVESIRHLSKHTNLIQDINENDEVMPSKILNINKDESYDTYENRFIYTLIQRMKGFLEIKKRENVTPFLKDFKKFEYQARSMVGKEKIMFNLTIDSRVDNKQTPKAGEKSIEERFARLEDDIAALTNTEVYKDLKKKNVALVIPPIKKTNVILKNNNFQFAMHLWNYLQNNVNDNSKRTKENKNYEDTGLLKEYINETFLLDYLVLSTLNKDAQMLRNKKEVVENLTNSLIARIVELNIDLPEEELREMLGTKIMVAKNKKLASYNEIQNAFTAQIKRYMDRISAFKLEGEK